MVGSTWREGERSREEGKEGEGGELDELSFGVRNLLVVQRTDHILLDPKSGKYKIGSSSLCQAGAKEMSYVDEVR